MSNLNELRPIQALSPFKSFCCTIGNLPSSYVESMSYMELSYWLCDYLKNTVIPAVNNNANAVLELQNLYVELKNYVDNYFANLDVQNEINNKLDEMAENGELVEIINAYMNTKAVLYYTNVQQMQNDTSLITGKIVETSGYNSICDGGKCKYIITDEELESDNYNVISLENGLKAKILFGSIVTPEVFGAKGNGIDDDTDSLQRWLDAHINHREYLFDIPSKNYGLNSGLNINYQNENYLIDFKDAFFKALDSNDYMLSINTLPFDSGYQGDNSNNYRTITGGHWDNDNLNDDIILYRARKINVKNIHLLNGKENYINVIRGSIILDDAFLDKRNYSVQDSVGIFIHNSSSDSKIRNVNARDIKTFTKCSGSSIFYENCHPWLVNILSDTVFCEYSNSAIFNNCYADTYNTVFKAFSSSVVTFTGGMLYWNSDLLPQNYEAPIILAHGENYNGNINVLFNNVKFDLYDLYTTGIKAKYTDVTPTNETNIGRNSTLLQYNRITPDYIDNLPPLAGYRNRTIETITERTPNNGEITYSQVRYIGNDFIFIKGIYKNDMGNITTNYGFAEMTQNNIKLSNETTYLNAFAYNSNTPNIKKPIIVDLTKYGYFHAFVEETLSNMDRIEFSGVARIDLLQAY